MATATCTDCYDDYCCPRHTARIHVYKEGDWMIDGVGEHVNITARQARNRSGPGTVQMTEACWSYDTFADAIAVVPEFAKEHATALVKEREAESLLDDRYARKGY